MPSSPPSAVVLSRFRQTPRPGVVEADLGQDARLGERREPAVLVLDDPDDGAGRGVRMPVPVLGEQPARADHRALRRPWPPRISVRALTARSSRSSTFAPAAIPAISSSAAGVSVDALALLAGVRAGRLLEHPAVERDACSRPGRPARARRPHRARRACARRERWTGNVIPLRRLPHPRGGRTTPSPSRSSAVIRSSSSRARYPRPITSGMHRVRDVPAVARAPSRTPAATCRGSGSGRGERVAAAGLPVQVRPVVQAPVHGQLEQAVVDVRAIVAHQAAVVGEPVVLEQRERLGRELPARAPVALRRDAEPVPERLDALVDLLLLLGRRDRVALLVQVAVVADLVAALDDRLDRCPCGARRCRPARRTCP